MIEIVSQLDRSNQIDRVGSVSQIDRVGSVSQMNRVDDSVVPRQVMPSAPSPVGQPFGAGSFDDGAECSTLFSRPRLPWALHYFSGTLCAECSQQGEFS